jgi:ligand-binding SRPBCC domain-containing protein
MPEFRLVTDIDAAIERVFDLARDIGLHEQALAHTGEHAIGGRMRGPIEAGETVTWRARHLGRWWTLTSLITTCESPSRFVDEQLVGPFAWFRHEHRFESTPTGTRMTDVWRHRSPFGIIGRIADRLVLTRHLRGMLEVRNAHLKLAAEAR